jgi:fatty acid-binding protein DegV
MCDLRDQGLSGAQIQEEAEKIVPCVRAQFAVKELEFLHKGGRCSGTIKFFGTLLRIRLILRIFNQFPSTF